MKRDDKVVLIHGFFGAPWTLKYHETKLKKAGFKTLSWGYPSRKKTIQEHAESLVQYLRKLKTDAPIHFVTHSMGGLILRAAINHPDFPNQAKKGRAVLLTPPNQGAKLGRMLHKWKLARWLLGNKSGKELMTEKTFDYLGSFPSTIKIKVTAGDLNYNPYLPSPSDSQVLLEETHLNTPHEHSTLHIDHLFILLNAEASLQIQEFLQND